MSWFVLPMDISQSRKNRSKVACERRQPYAEVDRGDDTEKMIVSCHILWAVA